MIPIIGIKKNRKVIICVAIILLFHLVGLTGLLMPGMAPLFLKIVPWHLLLMALILFISHDDIDVKFLLFVIGTISLGYGFEWLGVHRHNLFGDYYYGQTLGAKVSDVPLIISANWFLLIYSAGALMQRSRLRSKILRIIIGALFLVFLDILIEPVASRLDYWHWANDIIPIRNYTCWFLVSSLMLFIFELFRFKKQSLVAPVFLITQFLFFTVMY